MTGSREWTDNATMYQALQECYYELHPKNTISEPVLLVSGSARGADRLAEGMWARSVGEELIEKHPYVRSVHGSPLKRNDAMVAKGADLCAAFPTVCSLLKCFKAGKGKHLSHGTQYTIDAAKAAGIDVRIYLMVH